MSNFNCNIVNLGGRITNDLELKQLSNGTAMVGFGLAVNRKTKKSDGTREVDFINIKAFGKTAELIAQYFKKGSAIFIEGEVQTNSWTDSDGNKRFSTDVLANRISFVDSVSENTECAPPKDKPQGDGQNYSAPSGAGFEELDASDDLPF